MSKLFLLINLFKRQSLVVGNQEQRREERFHVHAQLSTTVAEGCVGQKLTRQREVLPFSEKVSSEKQSHGFYHRLLLQCPFNHHFLGLLHTLYQCTGKKLYRRTFTKFVENRIKRYFSTNFWNVPMKMGISKSLWKCILTKTAYELSSFLQQNKNDIL